LPLSHQPEKAASSKAFYRFICILPPCTSRQPPGTVDPSRRPRIVDEISYFTDRNILQLTDESHTVETQSGIRVYVYLAPSFQGETGEAFADHTARKWALPQNDRGDYTGAQKNDGYLIAGERALARLPQAGLTAIRNGTYQAAQQRVNNMGNAYSWMMREVARRAAAAATEASNNAPPPDVSASSAESRESQMRPSAANAVPPSVDTGAETVRAFYSALAQGDGAKQIPLSLSRSEQHLRTNPMPLRHSTVTWQSR